MQQEQAAAALGRGLCTLAVLEGDTPVGMGRLIGDGLYDTIVDVVVRPEYQGQGIGRAIIGRLLAFAEKEMPPGGRVSVSLIAEKGKEPFYEKLGFRKIPHEHCGSGMRKVLHRA
ncbi:MAG: GNAT family N-acetyltransferase [Provencibacterium sp.]|nr:GNAT family N-acetyltransferase [Provencibacterium sp.]